mmetsp:Transcript_29017/g.62430  ORF Transcript_29017/g.62430 Transcript_29017/m.62430 type:complete len:220 (-) Transcript_29017:269-928(-)|eukprot:CAMPEP_0183356330 /NCGR_PEP_ID=MMETSP0164_2-20130417/43998_1 /TAXON_ID=221442 /ORGANISM="Coccolithus pelagicus ssp braarudi, Strain PLY182g" /LENGTH=219 /DNA_ID=CAMNT_0025529713 /DNA_START=112 /DNA_END=771 /DNA_ORIENTATION=+
MSDDASWRHEFLDFCLECDVLRFGEFTLKSGRSSPYFFNAGLFNTGGRLARLGKYYAAAAAESGIAFDVLFGPAYKGIPLAATTAIALAEHHDRDVPYCYNRKEAKDHGEGGTIVGAKLEGRALVVDDVITAGTAARESAEIIQAQGARPAGLLIALDRQEQGAGTTLSAVQQVEKDLGIPVIPIATLVHLIVFLEAKQRPEDAARLRAHQKEFGCVVV